jgi:NTE family protein
LYALVLPFNKFKVGIPEALSKEMYSIYSVAWQEGINWDFKKLLTPFYVLVQIETGEQVILNKGNLAQAIIASSAFPSLFSPIVMDNRLIVDGGN